MDDATFTFMIISGLLAGAMLCTATIIYSLRQEAGHDADRVEDAFD